MKLQVAIYGVAAKKELEYEPERGLVRYLGAQGDESKELEVPLDQNAINEARKLVSRTAAKIRDRIFNTGPTKNKENKLRCIDCDFTGLCGLSEAVTHKRTNPHTW